VLFLAVMDALMEAASGHALNSAACAAHMDDNDALKALRHDFLFPKVDVGSERGVDALYLCGNSLGLQPKRTKELILGQLDKWADQGVEGHFTEPTPWLTIDGQQCCYEVAKVIPFPLPYFPPHPCRGRYCR
jgi:kynureninase